jgi:hypothetical protein
MAVEVSPGGPGSAVAVGDIMVPSTATVAVTTIAETPRLSTPDLRELNFR